MPYLKAEVRRELDSGRKPSSCGELNYAVTKMCVEYMAENPWTAYGTMNNVVGVLENVKLEMYRRLLAPFEDSKLAENGDVFR